MEKVVEHGADLGAAEDDDGNEDGQNEQPTHGTVTFLAIHVLPFGGARPIRRAP
jgi:hypothetical protein